MHPASSHLLSFHSGIAGSLAIFFGDLLFSMVLMVLVFLENVFLGVESLTLAVAVGFSRRPVTEYVPFTAHRS